MHILEIRHALYAARALAFSLLASAAVLGASMAWMGTAHAEPTASISYELVQAAEEEEAQSVTFTVAGVIDGQTFRLILDGELFQYTALEGDDAEDVADGFNGILTDAFIGCDATEGGSFDCYGPMGLAFDYRAYVLDGSGESENPYILTTCLELQDMNYELEAHYALGNDIECGSGADGENDSRFWNPNENEWEDEEVGGTLIPDEYNDTYADRVADVVNNGYYGFKPIGDSSSFTGSLDGQGFSVNDLWIFRKNTSQVGLLSTVSDGATVTNLRLTNAQIVGENEVGAVAGNIDNSTVSEITVEDSMVRAYLGMYGGGIAGRVVGGSTVTDVQYLGGKVHGSGNVIGGLFGALSHSTLENALSEADVDGGEFIGGAIGSLSNSTIRGVTASSTVIVSEVEGTPKTGGRGGGLVGVLQSDSTIEDSYATGTVSGTFLIGGFIGEIGEDGIIRRSYARARVSGVDMIGGFVGRNYGAIEDAYARGSVEGSQGSLGGFVGANNGDITNAYADVSVAGTGDDGWYYNVGGFVGDNIGPPSLHGTITASFAVGSVSGTEMYGQMGPFVGYSGSDIVDAGYWTGAGVEQTPTAGLEFPEDNRLAFKSTAHGIYENWDFVETWAIDTEGDEGYYRNGGWPYLQALVPGYEELDDETEPEAETFSISATAGSGGSISPSGTIEVEEGTDQAFTITANSRYRIKSVKVDGNPVGTPSTYTFSEVDADHTIEATFERVSSGSGGSTPAGTGTPAGTLTLDELRTKLADLLAAYKALTGIDYAGTPSPALEGVRDLEVGMQGDDVKALQTILIALGHSIPPGPTGYFGTYTRDALAAYQASKGITPAAGYFGPVTRAKMKADGVSGVWW